MSSHVRGHRPAGDNPWVCPNDRQLALRAKLKSGWSVKTSSLQHYRKPAPLNEREQHAIVNVIQKAESFEKKEQMRVGKLVERLDNMRRHAVGNGASTCVLCGEKFGLLTSSKLKCKDCHKNVCHKCVVDTSSTAGEQWLLCKICAETREVWKKSGAWFFKGMPRYVMPDPKRPPLANGATSRRRAIAAEAPASPRSASRYSWAKHVHNSGGSTANGDPSSPGSDGRAVASSSASPAAERRSGPADRAASLGSQRSSSLGSGRGASLESERGVSVESERGGSPVRTVDSSSEDEDAPRRSAVRRVTTYERAAPQLVSPAEEAAKTPTEPATANGDVAKDGCAEGTVRRSWSGLPTPHRAKRGSLPSGDRSESELALNRVGGTPPRSAVTSRRRASVGHHGSPGHSSRHGGGPAAAGTAEFSVMVDPTVESIHCCVHRVRGLCPMDGGTVNSYVKLHLVPGLHKTNKLRTRTVAGTVDPDFSETLTYCNVPAEVVATSTLWISVLDENPNGHDVLGETVVRLSDVPAHRLHHFSKPLLPVGTGDSDTYPGRILLSLKYVTSRRVLVVGVVRCVDLPAPDGNGVPDPFVKVQLRPAPGQFRTAICWKSPNPKFNEEFCFRCRRAELPRHTLDLRVYDKDISKSNDFIGSLQLSIDSHGARLRHWFDALNYVDTRHDRWHELSTCLPGPPPS